MIICNRGIWDSSSENCLIRPSNESRSSTRIWPVSWLMIHATEHKSAALLTLTDAASPWHLQNSEMHAFLYLKDVTGSILFWAIYMINMVPELPVVFPGSFALGYFKINMVPASTATLRYSHWIINTFTFQVSHPGQLSFRLAFPKLMPFEMCGTAAPGILSYAMGWGTSICRLRNINLINLST